MTDCCGYGNEPSASIKRGEFIHWLLNKGFGLSWLFGYLITLSVLMQHDLLTEDWKHVQGSDRAVPCRVLPCSDSY